MRLAYVIPHPRHIYIVECLLCHKTVLLQVISHAHTLSHAQNTSHAQLLPGRSFPMHMPWQRSDGKAESYILGCKHLDNSKIRMAHPKPVITHVPFTYDCPRSPEKLQSNPCYLLTRQKAAVPIWWKLPTRDMEMQVSARGPTALPDSPVFL